MSSGFSLGRFPSKSSSVLISKGFAPCRQPPLIGNCELGAETLRSPRSMWQRCLATGMLRALTRVDCCFKVGEIVANVVQMDAKTIQNGATMAPEAAKTSPRSPLGTHGVAKARFGTFLGAFWDPLWRPFWCYLM